MDGKPLILGVDDSLTIRRALEIVLKPAGYELELAADGAEAINKAKAVKPALILLDFILPDMRGTDVCRRLAADPDTAHIPVVLISAKGAEIRQAYCDIGNVVTYITKPFKPQAVISTVAEVLANVTGGDLVKLTVPAGEGDAVLPAPLPVAAAPVPPAPVAIDASFVSEFVPLEAPANGNGNGFDGPRAAAGDGYEDVDVPEAEGTEHVSKTESALSSGARRELLEWMFETLRAGLEGVYVEEVDTPAGAAADQAKSYTDLIEQLSRELDESLRHVRSGARFTLYGDGSLRSLDETLLDVFRRSCRLLFRAVVAGAVSSESTPNRRRILVACHQDSRVHEQLQSMLTAHPDWQVFTISSEFRQLPMVARLYGPEHLIAEVTGSGALWDQLRVLHRMPEARSITVLGIASAGQLANSGNGASVETLLAERGIGRVWNSAFELEREVWGDGDDPACVAAPTLQEVTAVL